jgi:hypothetical protein
MVQKRSKNILFSTILLIASFNFYCSSRMIVSQMSGGQKKSIKQLKKQQKATHKTNIKKQQKAAPELKAKNIKKTPLRPINTQQKRHVPQKIRTKTYKKEESHFQPIRETWSPKQKGPDFDIQKLQPLEDVKPIIKSCKESFLKALTSSICLREEASGIILYAIYNEMKEDEDILKLLKGYNNQIFHNETSILQIILDFYDILNKHQIFNPKNKLANNLNDLSKFKQIYKNHTDKISLLMEPTFNYIPFQENLIQKDKEGFTTIVINEGPSDGKIEQNVVETQQLTQGEYFDNKLELLFCGYDQSMKEQIRIENEEENNKKHLPCDIFSISSYASFLNFLLTEDEYEKIITKFLNKFLQKFPDHGGQTDIKHLEETIINGSFVYIKSREFMHEAAKLIVSSIKEDIQKQKIGPEDEYKISALSELSMFIYQGKRDIKEAIDREKPSKLSTALKIGGGIAGILAGIYLMNKKNILTPEKIEHGVASVRDSLLNWYNHSTVKEKIKNVMFFPTDQIFNYATSGISITQGSKIGTILSKIAGPAKLALFAGSFIGATAFLPPIFGLMLNPAGLIMSKIPFLNKYNSIYDLVFDKTIKKIFDKKIKILYRIPENLIVFGNTLFIATLQLLNANKPGLVGSIVKNMILPTILKTII